MYRFRIPHVINTLFKNHLCQRHEEKYSGAVVMFLSLRKEMYRRCSVFYNKTNIMYIDGRSNDNNDFVNILQCKHAF